MNFQIKLGGIMSIDENPEVRMFGFRINKTGTIILSFISITFCIQHIPSLCMHSQWLFNLFIHYTIPELLAMLDVVVHYIIDFIITLIIVSLLITIFVICAKMQKSFRREDTTVRWFFFRLTKASLAILFVLSLVYIIIDSYLVYLYTKNLIYVNPIVPIEIIISYIVSLIVALILMVIHLYTLIICVKNRDTFM